MSQAEKSSSDKASILNKIIISSAIIIFLHAFIIIICKDKYRQLFIIEQQNEKQLQSLQNTWSKLLLEYSTLDAPIRISQLANTQLNMIFPQKYQLLFIPPRAKQ